MTPSDNDDKWDARSSLRRRINDAARTTRNGWDGMEGWKERGVSEWASVQSALRVLCQVFAGAGGSCGGNAVDVGCLIL